MGKRQKILYMTIKDLKELGLLNKKKKRKSKRSSKKKYYLDANGKVTRTEAAPSGPGLYSGPNVERAHNDQHAQDERINDANRFKILMDNSITSIRDIQDKDRLNNNNKFKQGEDLYNNNVVPLMNGSSLGKSGGSDTFTHSSNTANRFQVNDSKPLSNIINPIQPSSLRDTIHHPTWEESQEKLNKELREANLITELKLKHQYDEQVKEQTHNKLVNPSKPNTLRGNKDVIVEDVEDEEENNKNGIVEEPQPKPEFKYDPRTTHIKGDRSANKNEYEIWLDEEIKSYNKKMKKGSPKWIKNDNLSTRTDYSREIIKLLKIKYIALGGTHKYIGISDPNVIDRAIKELKFNKEKDL